MGERLYRSGQEKMVAGVCGGLAEYFDVDVTLVRLIALIAILAWGAGILAYLIAWIIIPLDPSAQHKPQKQAGYEPGRNFDAGSNRYTTKEKVPFPGGAVRDAEFKEVDPTVNKGGQEEKQTPEDEGQEIEMDDQSWQDSQNDNTQSESEREERKENNYTYGQPDQEEGWYGKDNRQARRRNGNKTAGLILIVLGLLFFVDIWFPWYSFAKTWPLFIIALGVFIIFRQKR